MNPERFFHLLGGVAQLQQIPYSPALSALFSMTWPVAVYSPPEAPLHPAASGHTDFIKSYSLTWAPASLQLMVKQGLIACYQVERRLTDLRMRRQQLGALDTTLNNAPATLIISAHASELARLS